MWKAMQNSPMLCHGKKSQMWAMAEEIGVNKRTEKEVNKITTKNVKASIGKFYRQHNT